MEIVVSNRQPFPVEAVVFEEDTHLVLSAGNRVRAVPRTMEESLDELAGFDPCKLGGLVERGNQLFAIVHDFDNEPSFSLKALRQALCELARLSLASGLESIAIQAPHRGEEGDGHTWIEQEIGRAFEGCTVRRVWLIVD